MILKPKCTVDKDVEHNHFTMENVEPLICFYCAMQTDIPNVQYISWLEFLWREMELKMEFDHMCSILDFLTDVGEQMESGLAGSHPIFLDVQAKVQAAERQKQSVRDSMALLEESGLGTSARSSQRRVNFESVDLSKEEEIKE